MIAMDKIIISDSSFMSKVLIFLPSLQRPVTIVRP